MKITVKTDKSWGEVNLCGAEGQDSGRRAGEERQLGPLGRGGN